MTLQKLTGVKMDLVQQVNGTKKPPLVILIWRDIIKDPGWDKHKEVDCPVLRSVGWKVYEDSETIKIADTLDSEDEGYAVMALPKGCVKVIQQIEW